MALLPIILFSLDHQGRMDAEPELKDPSILDLLYFCPLI